jgi:hypothetical protein
MIHFFDIFLFLLLLSIIYYFFHLKKITQLYRFIKTTIIFSFSAKYAYLISTYLIKFSILQPNTFGIQLLFGFLFALVLGLSLFYLFEQLIQKYLSTKLSRLKQLGNFLIVIISSVLISTLSIYALQQIKPIKKQTYPLLMKSVSYPYIQKTYDKLFSVPFIVKSIISYK